MIPGRKTSNRVVGAEKIAVPPGRPRHCAAAGDKHGIAVDRHVQFASDDAADGADVLRALVHLAIFQCVPVHFSCSADGNSQYS
jgi:hypothetical protein